MLSGALSAAIDSDAAREAIAAPTVPGSANTAAIAPVRGRACISRARAATSRSPSSTVSTPAAQAAAYSPMLWPSTAEGSTPQDRHNSHSPYWMAKMAGCV